MKKMSSRLPVLLVLAAVMLGAWIEVASAGRGSSTVATAGSSTSVSGATRSGASTYSGDPDVGQNGAPAQKRLESLGDRRGSFSRPDGWTTWIWAIWNLRIAR